MTTTLALVAPAGSVRRRFSTSSLANSLAATADGSLNTISEIGNGEVLRALTMALTRELAPTTANSPASPVKSPSVSAKKVLAMASVKVSGMIRYVAQASAPSTAPATGSTPVDAAQLAMSMMPVGRNGSPLLRNVSRSTVPMSTVPPTVSRGSTAPVESVKATRTPVTASAATPPGSGSAGPAPADPATYWASVQPPGSVHRSSWAVSAPAGNWVTVAPVKSRCSHVAAVSSATVRLVTSAEVELALRTPRRRMLASPLPATAEASVKDLVVTGLIRRGTSTTTSEMALAGTPLVAVTSAVLESTSPVSSGVSAGRLTVMSNVRFDPAVQPTPTGLSMGSVKAMRSSRVAASYVTVRVVVDVGSESMSTSRPAGMTSLNTKSWQSSSIELQEIEMLYSKSSPGWTGSPPRLLALATCNVGATRIPTPGSVVVVLAVVSSSAGVVDAGAVDVVELSGGGAVDVVGFSGAAVVAGVVVSTSVVGGAAVVVGSVVVVVGSVGGGVDGVESPGGGAATAPDTGTISNRAMASRIGRDGENLRIG